MTEPQDPQLSQHYRDLEPLEPPGELDRAILAAGRRASPRRRRWYYSLAAAAVLVFAVALTLQIERERPDSESASQDGAARLRLSRELRRVETAQGPAARRWVCVGRFAAPGVARCGRTGAITSAGTRGPGTPCRRSRSAKRDSQCRTGGGSACGAADPAAPRNVDRAAICAATARGARVAGEVARAYRRDAEPRAARRGGQGTGGIPARVSELPAVRRHARAGRRALSD